VSETVTYTWEVDIEIETWVYLEGAAIDPGGTATYPLIGSYPTIMRTTLNDLHILPGQTYEDFFFGNVYSPPGQPYNTPPWNYNGPEGDDYDSEEDPQDDVYPASVVDWILVSLRASEQGDFLCTRAALLHDDGHVEFVDIEGFTCLCELDPTASYYIVIEHLDHTMVMSPEPIPVVNGLISFDFRQNDSYNPIPGLTFGQKQIGQGIWVMFGGNGLQVPGAEAQDITGEDRSYWQGQNNIIGLYKNGDYNRNGDVNYNDRKLFEFNLGRPSGVDPRD
jgi:hypothetical protein